MVFWFKSWLFGTPSPTSSNDNDFDTPGATNLVGLWDFNDGARNKDTGTADGIAQNGHFEDDAGASHGALHTDGKHDFFDVSGADGPFDLQSGTIETEFTQHDHVGSSPDTIVNRGEYDDRDHEGYFGIQVTKKGAVEVLHHANDKSVHLSTPDHFFDEGDDVRVAYSWDAATGVSMVVQNVSTGETYTDDKAVTGLNLEIGDNDDENFTFGAREEDDGDYDRFFEGQINYVAVFDKDMINAGDGIVTGSAGDDEIDVAYTGDPEGDLIDAGDAILAGEAPDDDIVDALDGNDTVLSGAGADDVYAGAGDDSVEGGAGDDLILGDSTLAGDGGTGARTRESFEWDKAPDPNGSGSIDDDDDLSGGFTQNTGSVDVAFSVQNATRKVTTEFADNEQKVHSITADGNPVDAHSSFESTANGDGQSATYNLDFSSAVENVSFRVNDIDGDGVVTVRAFNGTTPVAVTLDGGSRLELSDTDGVPGEDTAESEGGYEDDTSPKYSILVDIAGPVTRLEIEHEQDGDDRSGVNVTDVYFDAFEPVDAGDAGNDTLVGDAGDDTIFGEDGNDNIVGGTGADFADGGAGDDVLDDAPGSDDGAGDDTFIGGAGDDTLYGGNDEDVLSGGSGNDFANGEDGDDLVSGGSGNDTLLGESGQDTLVGGAGDDEVSGGSDNDLIYGDSPVTEGDFSGVVEVLPQFQNVAPGTETATGANSAEPGDSVVYNNVGTLDDGTVVAAKLVLVSKTDPNLTVDLASEDNDEILLNGVNQSGLNGESAEFRMEFFDQATGDPVLIEPGIVFSDLDQNVGIEILSVGDGQLESYGLPAGSPLDVGFDGTTLSAAGTEDNAPNSQFGELDSSFAAVFSPTTSVSFVATSRDVNSGFNFGTFDPASYEFEDIGGDDDLLGGDGDDTVFGQAGDDTLTGGEGADTLSGGDDRDVFNGGNAGDVVDGGTGGDDVDTLDLSGSGPLRVVDETVDADGDSTSGTVEFLDGSGSVTGTMRFEEIENLILPENTAPVAVDDPVTTDEDTPLTFNPADNDTDGDGDPLEVVGVGTPANGTAVLNGDGTVTYTPDADFNGTDTFEYTVDDGQGGTDTGTVTVTVTPVNDDPVANDDAETTPFNTAVTVPVLDNDTDVDGDTLSVTGATVDPLEGTAVVNGDNTITFTPEAGFTGDAQITYDVSDGNGGTDSAVLTVTVEPQPRDNIVEGTDAGETIDVGYTGDPEGDRVDNNDALGTFGEPVGSDDDSIQAGGGDDSVLAGDGDDSVIGEEGDDTLRGEDGNDILDGGAGNDSVSGAIGDDTVLGGGGEDLLRGGSGDDSLDGGADNDTLDAGSGNDTLIGGDGDDEIIGGVNDAIDVPTFLGVPVDADPDNDRDFVDAGAGDDTISTGDDADTIYAGDGDDVVEGGIDDDEVYGGEGDDSITDQQGSDFIDGGAGDDTIIAGVDTFSDYENDPNLPAFLNPDGSLALVDPNVDDGKDTVFGGAGDDLIATGDDADSIDGGTGDDTINAGIDDDTVSGGDGHDEILAGDGADSVDGGAGDDFIDASSATSANEFPNEPDATDPIPENDRDTVIGGAGNDTIITGDDDDVIEGGAGDDEIDAGIDDDTVLGGAGDDIITGGEGADSLSGGDGRDTFIGGDDGDVVDGGTGGDDFDTLDLTGFGDFQITGQTVDADGDSTSGTIEFLDGGGAVTGSLEFGEIEKIIPCFTPGTRIATPKGERLVEELQVGDRVITRDNGIQEIRWLGQKALTGQQLAQNAHLKPILIRAGSLGNNLPERDMLVSPNHRVLVKNDKTALYFEEREVLVAAKHLTGLKGVDEVETSGTTYIHFMFDHHEVVLSDGAWTESFQPGDYTLKGIGNAQRTEILELFPDLATQEGVDAYQSARRSLKRHEAKLLID